MECDGKQDMNRNMEGQEGGWVYSSERERMRVGEREEEEEEDEDERGVREVSDW